MKRLAFIAAAVVLLTSCVSAADIPETAVERGGYFEYRLYTAEVTDKGVREETRARLVILNDRGERFAGLSITGDTYNKIDNVRIDLYDSCGQRVYSKKLKDMLRTCGFGPSYSLYTSSCTYYIDLPGPAYPYTIEYAYTIESTSLFFLRGGSLQSYLPVVRAAYELKRPPGLDVHYQVRGLDIEPQITEGNPMVYRWEVADVAPLPNDDYLPVEAEEPAHLALSPHAFRFDRSQYSGFSWKEVGNWYRSLAADRYLPAGSPAAAKTGIEVIWDAYNRVLQETRYVAVSIGIGGWQPHPASDVQQCGYGDCKDMATLLVSYLRQAGVEAYPVLIATRGSGTIDPEFPSFGFNHVITFAIDGSDTIWMDPTCDDCLCGQLPAADQDVPVLAVTDTGGVLLRTPSSTADDNRWVRTTTLRLRKDHRLGIEAEWEVTGIGALRLQALFEDSDVENRLRRLEGYFAGELGSVKLTAATITGSPSDTSGLTIRLEGATERPVDFLKQTCYIPPSVYGDALDLSALNPETRKYPVNLGYPRRMRDVVTISWKGMTGVAEATAPAHDSVECDLGFWRRAAETGEEWVKVIQDSECREREVGCEQLAAFSAFVRARQTKAREFVKVKMASE